MSDIFETLNILNQISHFTLYMPVNPYMWGYGQDNEPTSEGNNNRNFFPVV